VVIIGKKEKLKHSRKAMFLFIVSGFACPLFFGFGYYINLVLIFFSGLFTAFLLASYYHTRFIYTNKQGLFLSSASMQIAWHDIDTISITKIGKTKYSVYLMVNLKSPRLFFSTKSLLDKSSAWLTKKMTGGDLIEAVYPLTDDPNYLLKQLQGKLRSNT
jgi:hypothetical protein